MRIRRWSCAQRAGDGRGSDAGNSGRGSARSNTRPICSPQGSFATSTNSLMEIAGGRRFTTSTSSTSGARYASRIIRPIYSSETPSFPTISCRAEASPSSTCGRHFQAYAMARSTCRSWPWLPGSAASSGGRLFGRPLRLRRVNGITTRMVVAVALMQRPALSRATAYPIASAMDMLCNAILRRGTRATGAPRKPCEGTKQEQVLAMPRRQECVTVAQIAEATGGRSTRCAAPSPA